MKKWMFILFCLLPAGLAMAEVPAGAFTYGEKLKYQVSYSLYFNLNVGEVTFEVRDNPRTISDRNYYHVVSHGRTYRFYDRFFKVRDRHESFIDEQTLLPRIFIRDIYEGGYESCFFFVF
jgi:hypothetical protein